MWTKVKLYTWLSIIIMCQLFHCCGHMLLKQSPEVNLMFAVSLVFHGGPKQAESTSLYCPLSVSLFSSCLSISFSFRYSFHYCIVPFLWPEYFNCLVLMFFFFFLFKKNIWCSTSFSSFVSVCNMPHSFVCSKESIGYEMQFNQVKLMNTAPRQKDSWHVTMSWINDKKAVFEQLWQWEQ